MHDWSMLSDPVCAGIIDVPDNIKCCKYLRVIDASVNPLGKWVNRFCISFRHSFSSLFGLLVSLWFPFSFIFLLTLFFLCLFCCCFELPFCVFVVWSFFLSFGLLFRFLSFFSWFCSLVPSRFPWTVNLAADTICYLCWFHMTYAFGVCVCVCVCVVGLALLIKFINTTPTETHCVVRFTAQNIFSWTCF